MTVSLQEKFDQINDHARPMLYDLLREWFPLGRMITKTEYGVGNLNGDEGDSLSINIHTCKWCEFAGGPGGHDPLGLYAHAFCSGDRKQAFRELRAKFGFSDDPPPPKRKPPVLKVVKPEEPEEWQPIVPPPDDVPGPNVSGYDHVFIYRDQGGRLLRYVVRNDAKGGKDKWVRPLTYGLLKGKPCWELRGPNDPKSLYGLERLDNAPVLLQEGEKKTDQMQRLLKDYACLSLTGGAAAINHTDLEPLAKRVVYYSPDNDGPGKKASLIIADKLVSLGATVMLVDVFSHGFPEKWDLGNAYEDGWTAEKIEAFLKDNAKLYEPGSGDVDQEPQDDDAEWKDEPPARDKRSLPPLPLGYDNGHYYYLSPMTGQIEVLARKSHTKHELIGIAGLKYYKKLPFQGERGGLDWDAIGDFLKGACSDMGFYRPDKVRGRGACLDIHRETGEVRAVLNLGNRLLVNGESHPLNLPGSPYIYEAARPLKYVEAPPLTAADAGKVAELCKLFSWEKNLHGTLMAGWLAVAPICGALLYRPAIWVTGGSGSGKSTLEALLVKPLLGDIGLFLKGGSGTTEAGVRQKLGRDARPLWFDEAESESQKAKGITQGLLDLNRQSSSEGGAEIIKGSQNQTGAKTYHVKSCFAFSAINPTLDHMADENRMSVLELMSHGAEQRADFQVRVVDPITKIVTPEFAAGFVARSVWLMPVILDNAKTFSKAVSVHLGSSRIGDQVGTLLAGAFSGISDKRVSPEAARKWVEEQDWGDTTSADAITDERRMLNHLMQRRVRLDLGGNKFQDVTMAELVKFASEECSAVSGVAQTELKRHGMKFENGGVWISNTHTALKEHLEGTPWSSQWARTLRRLPGTKPLEREAPAIKFAGELARATFVPLDLIG